MQFSCDSILRLQRLEYNTSAEFLLEGVVYAYLQGGSSKIQFRDWHFRDYIGRMMLT